MKQTFAKRFAELDIAFGKLQFEQARGINDTFVRDQDWQRWGTSALNLIKAAFGHESPHYTHLEKAFDKCGGFSASVRTLYGVFQSAKEDFEGGYIFDVDLRISGEVFGSFIALAKEAMSEGHKEVAAVLGCAALEDALKRYANTNGLSVDGKDMSEVISALKAKGLVGGAQKSLLDSMPKIRNRAMHADWAGFTETEVGSVIGFVEQLLLTKFSPP